MNLYLTNQMFFTSTFYF